MINSTLGILIPRSYKALAKVYVSG